MDQVIVFNDDFGVQVKVFEDQGFEWLYVVDFNGVFVGESVNGVVVDVILVLIGNLVQFGGGIWILVYIEVWLEKGIS